MILQRTVGDVAGLVGGTVEGPRELRLEELRPPEEAGPADLVALFRPSGLARLAARPACVMLPAGLDFPAGRAASLIRVPDAEVALDRLVTACAPAPQPPPPGVHPTAIVEPGVELGAGVAVGALAFVGARARIGAGSRLWPGAYVGPDAVLGAGCSLAPRVVIGERCVLGDRVLVHAGAVIGADGFGFRQDRDGRHIKIPQLGIVELGHDVEIGANTTVDRARFGTTRIGTGTKLDNQIHVGHNCVIGEHCAIAGLTAIAGSATIGDRVLIGGASAINGGAHIGAGARINGASIVVDDVEPGQAVGGNPARPVATWRRDVVALRRLPELLRRVRALEERAGPAGP
jgi:UDP-3-O-[3-hydroxymyristoyl] glucosamine N-acyltransferase